MLRQRLLFSHSAPIPPAPGGLLYSWGSNLSGQTGQGTTSGYTRVPTDTGTTNWLKVSAGGGSNPAGATNAIKTDGTLWGFGLNAERGVAGLGTTGAISFSSPTQVGSASNWTDVSQTGNGALAINSAGELWCWGQDGTGSLGKGATGIYGTPTQVGSATHWSKVFASSQTTFAIDNTGLAWTSGSGAANGTPAGTSTNTFTQVITGTWSKFSTPAPQVGGYVFTIGLQTDGTMWSCGYNVSGQTGLNLNDTNRVTSFAQIGTDTDWADIMAITSYVQTALTYYYGSGLAIKTDGSLWGWGSGACNGLGTTASVATLVPVQVGVAKWKSISGGSTVGQSGPSGYAYIGYGAGVQENGTLWVWGGNNSFQSGCRLLNPPTFPFQSGLSSDWESVAGGGSNDPSGSPFGFALKTATPADHSLYSWGNSIAYATGQNTTSTITNPTAVGSDVTWAKVVAFGGNTSGYGGFGIKSDGTMWSWGESANYGTGQGTLTDIQVPTQMGVATNWVDVAGFGGGGFAINSSGELYSWGQSANYQTGTGSTSDVQTPTKVGTDTNWAYVTGFAQGGFAIKNNGTLWSWGWTISYSTGQATTSTIQIPTQVGFDSDWIKVFGAAGGGFAIKANGTLWSWGSSNTYATGQNTLTNVQSPTQIGTDTDWRDIAATAYAGFAIKANGTLWSWGGSINYATGQGTLVDIQVPTQVGSDTTWTNVWGGFTGGTGFARKSNGDCYSWGYSADYVAGQGGTTAITSPVLLTGRNGWGSFSVSTSAFAISSI